MSVVVPSFLSHSFFPLFSSWFVAFFLSWIKGMEIVGCLRRDFSLNNFSSYPKKENAFSCLLTSLMLFVILKDLGSITWHEGITCIKTENLVLKKSKKKKKVFLFFFLFCPHKMKENCFYVLIFHPLVVIFSCMTIVITVIILISFFPFFSITKSNCYCKLSILIERAAWWVNAACCVQAPWGRDITVSSTLCLCHPKE